MKPHRRKKGIKQCSREGAGESTPFQKWEGSVAGFRFPDRGEGGGKGSRIEKAGGTLGHR